MLSAKLNSTYFREPSYVGTGFLAKEDDGIMPSTRFGRSCGPLRIARPNALHAPCGRQRGEQGKVSHVMAVNRGPAAPGPFSRAAPRT